MKPTNRISSLILLCCCFSLGLSAAEISVKSPDKQLQVRISDANGTLKGLVLSNNQILLQTAALGLTIDGVALGENVKMGSTSMSRINESYAIHGNQQKAINKANEASITITAANNTKYQLFVRVYNDGCALRYSIPTAAKRIDNELTSWVLPEDVQQVAWADFHQSYEGYSHATTLDQVPEGKTIMGPLTFKTTGKFLSFSEADCRDFSDMAFQRDKNVLKTVFPFSKNGWEIKNYPDNNPLTLKGLYKGMSVSPWRSVVVVDNLTELVNSNLISNLCEAPAAGTDFSYVLPGRSLWQWWSIGAPKYEDQKDWYNAAAKLKWEYYLVDDGWRYWKKDGKDQWALLEEVIAYGKTVGVKSIVWVDSKEFRKAPERRAYLERVKAIGADGIKIDFIPDATAEIMQWYLGTMQDCADLKLLLNFHGSVKPTGLTRTYPNDITREAVRGNEYHMSRYRRVKPYDHDVTMSFTRLLAGAADVTPVILTEKELSTAAYTWSHEFAQAIVFLSPITHFCDHYSTYLNSPMFDLFQEIPVTWDETKVLSCTEIGAVVAFARRKGKTWWIGVMNGANEKTVQIPLDFIKKKSMATLVFDGDKQASVKREEKQVGSKDILTVRMAKGGGFVARIK